MVGWAGSEKSQKLGIRVPSWSAFGFCSQAMIQSGRRRVFANWKLGAALAGSWFGASLPTTWQERHLSSPIRAVASLDWAAESAGASAVRYGKGLFAAAAK